MFLELDTISFRWTSFGRNRQLANRLYLLCSCALQTRMEGKKHKDNFSRNTSPWSQWWNSTDYISFIKCCTFCLIIIVRIWKSDSCWKRFAIWVWRRSQTLDAHTNSFSLLGSHLINIYFRVLKWSNDTMITWFKENVTRGP